MNDPGYTRVRTKNQEDTTMKEHTFTCCHCGHPHPLSERILVDDDELCKACANEETVICAHCGERIYRDDNAGDDNMPLCQSCYDRH